MRPGRGRGRGRGQSHRDTEAKVLFIGRLHLIVLLLVLTVLVVLVGLIVLGPSAPRASLIAASVLSVLGIWLSTVSLWLTEVPARRRWATIAGSFVVLAVTAGLLVALVAVPGSSDRLARLFGFGLFLSQVVALISWVACVLVSRKSSVVFTPSYREVCASDPLP